VLEFSVRLHHRVRIDRERVHHVLYGRQALAGAKAAEHHLTSDLFDELPVDRNTRTSFESEHADSFSATVIVLED
jgi:hypothetical protein